MTTTQDPARPCSTWDEFKARWGGLHNFLMAPSLVPKPFDYPLPPLEELIDRIRTNQHTIFRSGIKQAQFDQTPIPDAKTMPIRQLLQRPFVMAHFALASHFNAKGQVLEGLEEQWVQPWRETLLAQGFTFDNVFSIIFASGPNSASNYHWDFTHQMAFQRYGTKHFHGLRDPDHFTNEKLRCDTVLADMARPPEVSDSDAYAIAQPPGTILWNAVTTPHWVETFNEPAATLTLVHTNLRLNGKLCPHGEELFNYRARKAAASTASQPASTY
jgi:hypothetical protein